VQRLSGHPFEPWVLERIAQARSIALMTHMGPDADGLGSQLAFCAAARLQGVQVCVVNEDPLPERYRWLDPLGLAGHFERDAARLQGVDLGLIFDAHELPRAARPAAWLQQRGVDVWTMDHHTVAPDADVQGVVATDFSSTGELVYSLIRALGWPVDQDVARGIYAAISFDTGSFRFVRNQARTFRVAAELLETGLDANPIQEALFASRTRGEVELLGRLLNLVEFAAGGRIAWLACDDTITEGLEVAPDAIGEAIPTLIGIEGVLIAMMLKPGKKPGEWKLSLRSKTAVTIGSVARKYGGGGHEHAAGATLSGDVATLVPQILAELTACLHAQLPAAA
jgi:phosphoesterase RecJ-like protein